MLAAGVPDTGTWAFDTSATADGIAYRLRIMAEDLAGNVSSWSATPADFALDNTAPSVTLTSPTGGEVWSAVHSVTWTTTD